jgi:HAMP domain-containing protein
MLKPMPGRLSDLARLYVVKKEPQILSEYRQKESTLQSIETRLSRLKDNGATDEELAVLHEGLKIIDELQDEQQSAIASVARDEAPQAVALLYGDPYEQELDRVQSQIDHFRLLLDKRALTAVTDATRTSRTCARCLKSWWAPPPCCFCLCSGFILKRRVLRPVVRLSDVVHRLASQDYAVETPNFNQIDEIGDMAQAIRIFRENGLARQRLEKERDADWAIRELLARMTQRLQGCEISPM